MFLFYEKYNYTARCLYIEGIYLLFSLFFPVITLGAPLETKINGKVTNWVFIYTFKFRMRKKKWKLIKLFWTNSILNKQQMLQY